MWENIWDVTEGFGEACISHTLGSVQCLCRWCVVCVSHQSGANGDRAAFSLWTQRWAHWSLQAHLYKLGELQACSHSFQPSLEFLSVAQAKAEFHFSLRHCCDEPFLCCDINLAISSFPLQTKQQHRLAVIINFVQEARAECSSISDFHFGWRGHSSYLLLFQLQSFLWKYDTSHGTGSGFGDEGLGDQCNLLVGCRLEQLLIQVNKKIEKKKNYKGCWGILWHFELFLLRLVASCCFSDSTIKTATQESETPVSAQPCPHTITVPCVSFH